MSAGHDQNRHSQLGGGYYGGQRPESYAQNGGPPPRTRYGNRIVSDPGAYGHRPYPQHTYHQSQDTMNTGVTNGSDSTGPWANSTDPSSENSSIDKVAAATKGENQGMNGHGPNGYGNQSQFQGPIMEEQGSGSYGGAYPQQNGFGPRGGAPPAQAPNGQQRRPIPLGNSGPPPANLPSQTRAEPEKRKSWLSRRFSKKEK